MWSIASNNANNLTEIAILGDQVTLTIAASEPIKGRFRSCCNNKSK